MISVDYDTYCIYIITTRETIKKAIWKDTPQNTISNSRSIDLQAQLTPTKARRNSRMKNKWNNDKTEDLRSDIPMIILNVSGLTIPIKRQRLVKCVKTTQLYIIYKKKPLKFNDMGRLKGKGYIYNANIKTNGRD